MDVPLAEAWLQLRMHEDIEGHHLRWHHRYPEENNHLRFLQNQRNVVELVELVVHQHLRQFRHRN